MGVKLDLMQEEKNTLLILTVFAFLSTYMEQ